MDTPFLEVVENAKKLHIRTAPEIRPVYANLIRNVFIRLNNYFVSEKLYDCNEHYNELYQTLMSKYDFKVSKIMKPSTKGTFLKSNYKPGSITLNHNCIYEGVRAEGYLCHEIVHLLSLGLDFITYKIPKGKVEITLPNKALLKAGYKKTTIGKKEPVTEIFTYNALCENNFIKEGMTELLKQQIYTNQECPFSYVYQTQYVKLLDYVCGVKHCFKDLLQGDLITYKKYFGKEPFKQIDEYLKNTLNDYHSFNIFISDSANFLLAIDLVVRTYLIKQTVSKISVKEYINKVLKLSEMLPIQNQEYLFNASIKNALKLFEKDGKKNKEQLEAFKDKYKEVIDSKILGAYYSNQYNCSLGFKLNGLKRNIYFKQSYEKDYPANAYLCDTDLTVLLLPKKENCIYEMNSGSLEESILKITKLDAKTFLYKEEEITKKIVFEKSKCFVFDENEKLVDEGYLYAYDNKKYNEEKHIKSYDELNNIIDNANDIGMDTNN